MFKLRKRDVPPKGCRPHSYWVVEPGAGIVRRQLSSRLLGLAEILESFGRSDEARRIAQVGLKGYVTIGNLDPSSSIESNNIYMSAIEFLFSRSAIDSVSVRNSLIRLYSRLLHTRSPEVVEWSSAEHAILRSCVLHANSGGAPSALADLQRKCRIWRYNSNIHARYARRKQKQRKSQTIGEWTGELFKQY